MKNLEPPSQPANLDSNDLRVLEGVLTPQQLNFAVVVGHAIAQGWRAEHRVRAGSPDTKLLPNSTSGA